MKNYNGMIIATISFRPVILRYEHFEKWSDSHLFV